MNGSPVRAMLALLVAIATIPVIVGLSVALFLNPIWIGFEQDRAGVAGLTGFSPDEVREVTNGILHDLVVGPPDFGQTVDGVAVLDDRERSHMADVRLAFVTLGALVVLAVLILVNARLASGGAPWFRRAVGSGAVILAVGVVAGAIVVALAFDVAFDIFHRLFFAGGSYTFDPSTERLVQLFPEALFEESAIAVGAAILAISGAVAWWGVRRRNAS